MNLTTTEIDFINLFENYDLPMLNWVRLPSIKISKEEKEKIGLTKDSSNFEFLKAKTKEGFERRLSKSQILIENKSEYYKRLKEEFDLIDELGFTDYYLLVWRVIEYAKTITGYLDPARGSCGGSCVFYMLGVTQLDPVRHNLFLSRFISKARANKKIIDGETYIQGDLAPDVDLNFAKNVRSQIIHWLENEYGGKMAQIATYSSLTTKILIKEVYKSMNDEASEDDAKLLSDTVQSIYGKLESLETVYENNEYFKQWADENKEQYDIAKKIRDLPKGMGSHASGFVISFDPLEKISPLTLNKDNELTCLYEMNDISKLSLKLDLLGLTTNKIIEDCLQSIGKTYDDINLDDNSEIYRHFQDSYHGTGIYQIEKGCGYNTTRAVKPQNISELSDVNALARPGALSYLSDYVNNTGECPYEIFRPILSATRFQPLYQEQMIQMAIALGFSASDGEIIRRASAKKSQEKMAEWEPKVKEKCKENGYGPEVADYFWKLLKESADYSFNKCVFEREKVELESGKKIELRHVKIGDSIKCFDTTNSCDRFFKVKNIYRNKVKCYEVSFLGGHTIICSSDHKFLCYQNGQYIMKQLKDMSILHNDLIVTEDGACEIEYVQIDRLRHTIDLEIDSTDHNFYCNGIVVSNSHSTGVSYVGALTTYLKYNHPKEFYTAFLNNCREFPDYVEKTSSAIREMKHFGIKILAPNLLKSKDDFTVEKNGIRYGLKYIKGVSDNSLEQLAKFQKHYENKFEIFRAMDELKIKLNVICPLIQAGALEDENKETRTYCVFEAQVWKNLTQKEKNIILEIGKNHDYDLLACLRYLRDTNKVKESRMNTLRKNTDKYKEIYNLNKRVDPIVNWFYEYKLLGFSYSDSLVNVFTQHLQREGLPSNFPFYELKDLTYDTCCKLHEQEEIFKVIGIVLESKITESKNGNKYLKVLIEDGETRFNVFMMDGRHGRIDDLIAVQNGIPEKEELVVCQGKVSKPNEDRDPLMFAEQVVRQKDIKVFLKLHELKTYQKSK